MGSLKKRLQDVFRESRDALICTHSNSEESLYMQLPSEIRRSKFAVIITPTREFAKRQVDYLKSKSISAFYWNACSSTRAKNYMKTQMTADDPKIKLLYVTYQQVLTNSHIQFKLLQAKRNVSTFIIDEADYLSPQSSEFRSAYMKLGTIKKKFPEIPIIAFTTSTTEKVGEDIIKALHLQSPLILENKVSAEEDFTEPEAITLDSDSGESIEFIGEERCTNEYKVCEHLEPCIKLFKLCKYSKKKRFIGEECPSCNDKEDNIEEVLEQIKNLLQQDEDSEDSIICISDDSAESPLLFSD